LDDDRYGFPKTSKGSRRAKGALSRVRVPYGAQNGKFRGFGGGCGAVDGWDLVGAGAVRPGAGGQVAPGGGDAPSGGREKQVGEEECAGGARVSRLEGTKGSCSVATPASPLRWTGGERRQKCLRRGARVARSVPSGRTARG